VSVLAELPSAGSARAGQGALLRLLWLVSPALPIGAYAYSRGLEYAVEAGWATDSDSVAAWVEGVLERQIATLDAPVLARLHDAYRVDDARAVQRWSDFLRASRETAEMALEDRQLGLSLAKVLREAGVPGARAVDPACTYVQMFALACVAYGVSRADAVLALLFTFAEGQVISASKLVPLGQSASQRALARLLAVVEPLAQRALVLADDELGTTTPGLALASMLHETQYTRLFRS
jgi:urease accessory protein